VQYLDTVDKVLFGGSKHEVSGSASRSGWLTGRSRSRRHEGRASGRVLLCQILTLVRLPQDQPGMELPFDMWHL
jgi:hypothetical protein